MSSDVAYPLQQQPLTVAEYMNYWLEHIAERSVRRTTYATYEGDVRLHIFIPGIGTRKLKSLQASHIRAWLTWVQTRCQRLASGQRMYCEGSSQKHGAALSDLRSAATTFYPPVQSGTFCVSDQLRCRMQSTKKRESATLLVSFN